MSDESRGVVYVSEGEPSPGRGEPILIVPISPVGLPDWAQSTFGAVGEIGERWIRIESLPWQPRHGFSAWEHQCSIMAGLVAGRHVAVPFRSALFGEIVEDRRSDLWVGVARHASDDAARTRELQEAKQEIRGLRKRMRVEREVTIGIFTGLLDKEATGRFIAHLERLIARIEAAEAPSAKPTTPLTTESVPLAAPVQPTAYPALIVEMEKLHRDLTDLDRSHREGQRAEFTFLIHRLSRILASLRAQPTAAPAKSAVDPEVIGMIEQVRDEILSSMSSSAHKYDSEGLADALTRHLGILERVLTKLRGAEPTA